MRALYGTKFSRAIGLMSHISRYTRRLFQGVTLWPTYWRLQQQWVMAVVADFIFPPLNGMLNILFKVNESNCNSTGLKTRSLECESEYDMLAEIIKYSISSEFVFCSIHL